MIKKIDSAIKEYVCKLPFDSLKYLFDRFDERIGPDLSEAIDFVSKNPEVDRLLASAKNGDEFWATVDMVSGFVEKEFHRRIPDLVSHA
jgi:hypothetical protein